MEKRKIETQKKIRSLILSSFISLFVPELVYFVEIRKRRTTKKRHQEEHNTDTSSICQWKHRYASPTRISNFRSYLRIPNSSTKKRKKNNFLFCFPVDQKIQKIFSFKPMHHVFQRKSKNISFSK